MVSSGTRRGFFKWAATAALALAPLACLSPTLPLPPPASPTVTAPDSAGMSTVAGMVPDQAKVFVQNLSSGQIAGQKTASPGDYTLRLAAESGDRLVLWYTLDLEQSTSIELLVPAAKSTEGGAGGAGGAGD